METEAFERSKEPKELFWIEGTRLTTFPEGFVRLVDRERPSKALSIYDAYASNLPSRKAI
jgi:hypothetical protein